jgi:hypothetical protein
VRGEGAVLQKLSRCPGFQLPSRRGTPPTILLSHEELTFIKALTTLELSPALLKELSDALTSRRKKKPAVSAASSSTIHGGGFKPSQRPSRQHASKRKANELTSSGDTFYSANRRPARGARSEPRAATIASVTEEEAAVRKRQSWISRQGRRTKLYWPGP